MQLKGEVDKAKATPRLAIDGSDTAANQLTPGTILVYRTSDGNYGKLQVIEYGYNLVVRWQTYPVGSDIGQRMSTSRTSRWIHDVQQTWFAAWCQETQRLSELTPKGRFNSRKTGTRQRLSTQPSTVLIHPQATSLVAA
jgi:hypothetical protein